MYYPDPITVRMVKQTLKDTAKDCAVIGAASVVEGVMGTLWGSLFNLNNNREYLNFIGELAGRTLSNSTKKFATQVYKNANAFYDKNGKLVVRVPAAVGINGYLNDDGNRRGNNHSYDVVGVDTDLTNKFRYNYKVVSPKLAQSPNPDKKKSDKQKVLTDNNKSNNKQLQVVSKNKVKPQDNSELLLSAIDDISTKPLDFSFASFFLGVRNKILKFLGKRTNNDLSKDVLKGCYEYLEESGYDAYPIMVDLLSKQSVDFSEKVETVEKSDLSIDLADFKRSARMYQTLNEDQRKFLMDYVKGLIGEEAAYEYIWSMQKYAETSVPPTKKRLGIFKILSAIAVVLSVLLTLCVRPTASNK